MQRVAKSVLINGQLQRKGKHILLHRQEDDYCISVHSLTIEALSGCFHSVLGRKSLAFPWLWNVLFGLRFVRRLLFVLFPFPSLPVP